ncbi:hypothetical protein BE21_26455 [Sorangium cellulosum]|uniref:Uncharacterized protein n=1 Tax=Sorangium cellulosum TaxID=56 RepID=A0A150TTQ2_SORCE|nr:hypothetical protein BE21_26455 [Sorangium cellulosum]
MMALGAVAMLISGSDEITLPPFQGGWAHAEAPSRSGGSAADPDVIAMRAGDVSSPPGGTSSLWYLPQTTLTRSSCSSAALFSVAQTPGSP